MGTMIDCGPAAREILSRLSTPTRNRYYYGKLLDSFHLELEQEYGNRKRWLINRLSLGTGVLCGLKVVPSNDRLQVRVGPGVAIDAWGREIVVEKDSPGVDPRQPTDDCGRPVGPPLRRPGRVTLWICYHECEAEPAPVLVSECERECENGLIRERYRLRITAGVPRPPALVSGEQCRAIFSAGDRDARRSLVTETLRGPCLEPNESCVPLAIIELDANGRIDTIDPIRVRPMLYSNAVLLDLILCLASRVDECCPPQTVNALRIVSGDGQTGDVGQPLAQPLVVRVTKGAAPVQGEQVTFKVASGQGQIGAPPNLAQSFQVNSAPDGTATLPRWQLGPVVGGQSVTAEIASGAPNFVTFQALGRAVQVDLPVINAVWPPPRMVLSRANRDTALFFDLFLRFQSIELVFSRQMLAAHLTKPKGWLRLFLVSGVRNQYFVRHYNLRHANAAETADRIAAFPAFAPGVREFFIIEIPQQAVQPVGMLPVGAAPAGPPAAAPAAAPAGAPVGARAAGIGRQPSALMMSALQPMAVAPSHTIVETRALILVNADVATKSIVDAMNPPHVLDAEYMSSTLQSLPGSAGGTLWDDVWNAADAVTPPVMGQNLWDALTTATGDLLPSGNGAEGGRFDSWFGIQV